MRCYKDRLTADQHIGKFHFRKENTEDTSERGSAELTTGFINSQKVSRPNLGLGIQSLSWVADLIYFREIRLASRAKLIIIHHKRTRLSKRWGGEESRVAPRSSS
jgi:hypothetical protein